VKADTVRALAEILGIDPDGLEKTVTEYNASSVDTPYDATILDHKHTVGIQPPKSHYAQPLLEPPFEAWPIGVQICFTFEGLKVGDTTQVLDTEDRPIEGLHAAGEIVGIFHGDTYPAGTSVLRALTFGRLAGLEVASSLAAEI
jgi:tricarballylate dehydrogenase